MFSFLFVRSRLSPKRLLVCKIFNNRNCQGIGLVGLVLLAFATLVTTLGTMFLLESRSDSGNCLRQKPADDAGVPSTRIM